MHAPLTVPLPVPRSLPVAIIHTSNSQELVDYRAFQGICQAPPPNVVAVSRFVPPRGVDILEDEALTLRGQDTTVGNYFHSFHLSDAVQPQFRCYKFGSSNAIQGFAKTGRHDPTQGCAKVLVRNDRLTKEMNQIVQTVINRCEAENGCRVVKMDSEFLQDANGNLWFVRTSDVETTMSDKLPPKISNEASHHKRTVAAPKIERGMENEGLKARQSASAVVEELKDMRHGGVAGSRTGNRIQIREFSRNGPDEELVDLIMNESDATEAIRKKVENQKAKDDFKRKSNLQATHKSRSMSDLAERLGGDGEHQDEW